ncbi:MAG: hypothetical protein KDH16_22865 [Rhodocyclaceae bacterium]|nr:hypothetical protein [Rhodocyclaceae bacterium]
MGYAQNTTVPVERSRAELERTLSRYGASAFGYMTNADTARIFFEANGRRILFELALPDRNDREFTHHSRGERTAAQAEAMWEQACRQKWRALNLVVKAKLEAVDAGISEFEDEFLANILLPSGQTMGDVARPAIAHAYDTGTMPALMPGRNP